MRSMQEFIIAYFQYEIDNGWHWLFLDFFAKISEKFQFLNPFWIEFKDNSHDKKIVKNLHFLFEISKYENSFILG